MSKILTYPNKRLRKIAKKVEDLSRNNLRDFNSLVKKLKEADNGVGLAAPQIGISKRFFGMKDENKEVKVFINPRVLKKEGERSYFKIINEDGSQEDFLEGCLSVPGFLGTVKRFLNISVEWMEVEDSKKLVSKKENLSGFKAIVWQHESDHLDGKLFIDYVKKENGTFFKGDKDEMVEVDIDSVSFVSEVNM